MKASKFADAQKAFILMQWDGGVLPAHRSMSAAPTNSSCSFFRATMRARMAGVNPNSDAMRIIISDWRLAMASHGDWIGDPVGDFTMVFPRINHVALDIATLEPSVEFYASCFRFDNYLNSVTPSGLTIVCGTTICMAMGGASGRVRKPMPFIHNTSACA